MGTTSLDVVRRAMQGIPGLRITSTYRSPSHNANVGGSPTSWHMNRDNPAVDISGPTAGLDELARRLAAYGGNAELLWRTKGHWDHVHFAIRGDGSDHEPYGDHHGGHSVSYQPAASQDHSQPQTVEEYIQAFFPTMSWALDHPSLGPILRRAGEEEWDAVRLQGAVQGTDWWQSNSDRRRELQILRETDPQTYQNRVNRATSQVLELAETLGIPLNSSKARDIAGMVLRNNLTEREISRAIMGRSGVTDVGLYQRAQRGSLSGAASQAHRQIEDLAQAYLVKLTPRTRGQWIRKIVMGTSSVDDFEQFAQQIALARDPWVKDFIDQGLTPMDGLAPYRDTVSRMLEMPASQVDFTDGKMQQAVTVREDGKRRLATTEEASENLRRLYKRRWNRTSNAKQSAAMLTSELATMFGRR